MIVYTQTSQISFTVFLIENDRQRSTHSSFQAKYTVVFYVIALMLSIIHYLVMEVFRRVKMSINRLTIKLWCNKMCYITFINCFKICKLSLLGCPEKQKVFMNKFKYSNASSHDKQLMFYMITAILSFAHYLFMH